MYLKQNKCHFFNNADHTNFAYNIVGDPYIEEKSEDLIEFENYSLVYPNLKCLNKRPREFKLVGSDHFNRDCFDLINSKNGRPSLQRR